MFDTKTPFCAYAEQSAAFAYGELDGSDKAAFETHLNGCAACADDANAFGALRVSIADWRALEFDRLVTPRFDFPFESEKQTQQTAFVAAKNDAWFGGWRKIFAPAPAFAFATLLLAICAGLVAYNFSGKQQFADLKNQSNTAPAIDANVKADATENTNENANRTPILNGGKNERQIAATNSSESNAFKSEGDRSPVVENRRAVKISNESRGTARNETTARKTVYTATAAKSRKVYDANQSVARNGASAANKRSVPKLNAIEDDDEDQSLRLIDLFDDAGGK